MEAQLKSRLSTLVQSLDSHRSPFLASNSSCRRRHRAAVMLRLRSRILAYLLSSPATCPISPLHRLLSAAASPTPAFAVEQYLIATCGLTQPQALKAFTKLSHLKSPANPDAVLAFLAGLGLSSADVAATVAKDPQLLCAGVERTLAPNVAALTALGLSRSEIARLVSLAPGNVRIASIVSKLRYYRPLFGSYENILRVLKPNSRLLDRSLEKMVKPNVAFLRECELGDSDISKLCLSVPWLIISNPERLHAMVARAEALGVPRGAGMFRHALDAVAFCSEEKITVKVVYLKKAFRWSDAEVGVAVCKAPNVLRKPKEALQSRSDFLISDVGLEPAYIAHRPAMLSYSLVGRLRPRYYVVKFLKENGLLGRDRDYYTIVAYSEKVFVEKFICPHKEAAPHLAEDYAAACRGEMPTRFRFT